MDIQVGTADVTRYVMIVDSSDGSPETGITVTDLDMQYTRVGAAPAAKADAGDLGATDAAHGDNKIYEVDGTSSPGLYRVDWPDAAFASGVSHVILYVTGTGFSSPPEEIQLVGTDPDADLTDSVSSRVFNGTSTNSSTASKVFVQPSDPPSGGADDNYNNMLLFVWDTGSKSTGQFNLRTISDYDDSDPSFIVDTDLDFTPNSGDLVEVWAADTTTLAALTSLSTGFGSGSDSLHGHVSAMMDKTASDPSDVGTYAAATDSQESIRELLDSMAGSGFSTGTDSLTEIRDAIDTLVAPSVVGASALSGSGFLSDCVTLIRRMTDEPSLVPKYTDSDIVEQLTSAMSTVMAELHINSDHNILCRFDITLVSGQQTYILPPNVGEIWAVRKMSTVTPIRPVYEAWSDNHWSAHQSGFVIEGNEFRLLTDWRSTDVLEVLYVPNGESFMHKGTAQSTTDSTITFATSATDGTLDTRANAYAGYLCRILEDTTGYIQERTIDSYVNTTLVATLTTDFSPSLTGSTIYEVLPTYSNIIKHAACMNAAMDILGNEGNKKRLQLLERRYLVKIRALRQLVSKKSSRFGSHAIGDTADNDDRGDYFGWLV
jgi:hypothetical protein